MAVDDVARRNQRAWDGYVRRNNRWTCPVDAEAVARARRGDVSIVLTPNKPVPSDWLGALRDREVLCLASGGGQQGPLLSAAGAKVTVFDLSHEQLEQDRKVAARESLALTTEQGDMRDLSRFADGSFDLIVHPISNCFIPDLAPLWSESYRVLRRGGELLAGFTNPALFLFDYAAMKGGQLIVRYKQPYADSDHFDAAAHEATFGKDEALEFGHSLDTQIGGQLRAGFVLTAMYEDEHSLDSDERLLSDYFPPFVATRAEKR